MGKTIIIEGRYDSAVTKVIKDIMTVIKRSGGYPEDTENEFVLPYAIDGTEEYELNGLNQTFSVEFNVFRNDTENRFKLESFKLGDDEDVIQLNMIINRNDEPNVYSEINMKLQEDVRHEMEHILQEWGIGDRPFSDNAEYDTVFSHHTSLTEVPAMVQGFYRRAKKMRLPLDVLMKKDLEDDMAQGKINQEEADELLRVWLLYSKRRLPHAVYTNQ